MSFKDFHCARNSLCGIELMHMITKGQMNADETATPAEQFYSLTVKGILYIATSHIPSSVTRQSHSAITMRSSVSAHASQPAGTP